MRRFFRKTTPVAIAAAVVSLGGCQMLDREPPVTSYRILAQADPVAPVSVAAPLVENSSQGTQYNQWGGIVPDAKPSTPVDDGGLGEIRESRDP